MKSHLRLGVALTVLTLALQGYGTQARAAGEKVGVSAAVRGSVQVRTGNVARAARSGETMLMGDRIASRAESGMQIMLLDETTFTVGAECDVTIDEFVYDPTRGAGSVSATVSKGALRYVSGLIAKDNPDAVKLKTPSSTIGLRGTNAYVVTGAEAIKIAKMLGYDVSNADPATASLVVLVGPGQNRNTLDRRGEVSVTNGAGSQNIYKSGYGVFVPSKDAAPLPPVRFNDEAMRVLIGMLTKGAMARAGGSGMLPGGSAVIGSGQDWVEGRPFDREGSLFDEHVDDLSDKIKGVQKGLCLDEYCNYGNITAP